DAVDQLLRDLAPRHLLRRDVADVVDEHVEPAEAREDLLRHPPDLVPPRQLGLDGERLPPEVADLRGHGLRALGRAVVVDGDVGALPREPERDRAAEAAAGAGDERVAPVKAHAASSRAAAATRPAPRGRRFPRAGST